MLNNKTMVGDWLHRVLLLYSLYSRKNSDTVARHGRFMLGAKDLYLTAHGGACSVRCARGLWVCGGLSISDERVVEGLSWFYSFFGVIR
jgi:hypothetical protein